MDIFDHCYDVLIQQEGKYGNNPQDAGGETYKGIARNRHGEWSGWAMVDSAKTQPGFPANLEQNPDLQNSVKDFYRTQFWNLLRCPEMPPPLALMVFDEAVNEGPDAAARDLQKALGVTVDGNIGDQTIAAATNKWSVWMLSHLAAIRGIGYTFKHDWPVFQMGWMTRLMEVHRQALAIND